ncbi:hypothetical protein CRM22_009959 [Opisthorchis felineus]|uniref:Uncharacterized protein n=1 Tax=Opisthorchis felineus TaxID=147828 RepID=A0A4S2L2X5_OPIFE|nr:hypothetical protein CRM22_009959 [Opisthorchis felineus]
MFIKCSKKPFRAGKQKGNEENERDESYSVRCQLEHVWWSIMEKSSKKLHLVWSTPYEGNLHSFPNVSVVHSFKVIHFHSKK